MRFRLTRVFSLDLALLLVAFGFGFAASATRLPPLVGYLVAGFVLHAFGYESTEAIDLLGDLGVLLLLFGIGLKLRLRTLRRPVVWAGASMHMAATTGAHRHGVSGPRCIGTAAGRWVRRPPEPH